MISSNEIEKIELNPFFTKKLKKKRKTMTVGWAQLLVLVIVGMVLFGNLPKIVRDLGKSAEEASDSVNRIKNKLAEKESSSKEGK